RRSSTHLPMAREASLTLQHMTLPPIDTREEEMTHDPLLQPLTFKGLTLKNRIMSAAHAPGYAEHGLALERYQLYHEEKAKGELALTMFGGSATISSDSPSIFGQLDVSTD